MTRPTPPLLCDTCGYPLTGLPLDARCPECAAPVADADPRRIGTPWQRRVRARWSRTWAALMFRPRPTLAAIAMWATTGAWLLAINAAVALTLPLATAAALWAYAVARGYAYRYEFWLALEADGPGVALALVTFAIITGGVCGLAMVSLASMITHPQRNLWRRVVAVAAHASFAWVTAAAAFSAYLVLTWFRPQIAAALPVWPAAWIAFALANVWFVGLVIEGMLVSRPRVRSAPPGT